MEIKEIIKELCDIDGPSGFEGDISLRARELLSPYMDETNIDVLGNTIGVKRCGKANAKKMLIDAHIDEIGFIITGIQEGFLKFASIGGVDSRTLPASELRILTEPPITGFVACMPPHTMTEEMRDKPAVIDDLFLDIGMTGEEAQSAVPLGTPAVFASDIKELTDEMVSGKGLDDRACFGTVLYALELIKGRSLDFDLYVMASVQEEVGHRGARAGVYGIAPDHCVVLDVTHAHTPDARREKTAELGGGPAIGIGSNMNRDMTKSLMELAALKNIPCQAEPLPGSSGTNAHEIQISREGVATALLSLPLKYMHTPVETISLKDARHTAELLAAYLETDRGWA